ncbi:hypothetical protein L7F22_032783 [Adiantum nelumboides]|nr:hypothetical protein [Adiantum nelumboides]
MAAFSAGAAPWLRFQQPPSDVRFSHSPRSAFSAAEPIRAAFFSQSSTIRSAFSGLLRSAFFSSPQICVFSIRAPHGCVFQPKQYHQVDQDCALPERCFGYLRRLAQYPSIDERNQPCRPILPFSTSCQGHVCRCLGKDDMVTNLKSSGLGRDTEEGLLYSFKQMLSMDANGFFYGTDDDDEDVAALKDMTLLRAIVKVYCVSAEPDYSLPWQLQRQFTTTGSGFMIAGKKLITNAHCVEHHTQVTVKRTGDDTKYIANVLAIGADCDLALLSVQDEEFWKDAKPLEFGSLPALQSWLYQYDPIISFRDHFHNNQKLELRGLFNTQPVTMVSAMQVKRLVRKRDCTTALVMLREAEDDTENAVADALSRMPKATNFAISGVQMEIQACFKDEYLTDKDFGDAFRALKSLNLTPAEMNMFASYTVMDELLYYLDRICVPHNGALRKILIQEHHVQQKYQKQANKHRRHAEFNEGDLVLLYVASLRYKTVKSVSPKLRPRFYGPLKIIKKNSIVSHKLELPPSWGKLHPTFHISWLKQYIQGDSHVRELSSYVPEIVDKHVILVPEMILDVRQKETRRKLLTEFLVKWMDLDESDSTWQTDEEMQQYPNLLQEFFDKWEIFL